MNSLNVFIHKEMKEQLRTYKLLIIMTVFVLFGISSPIFAKLMPDLLGNMDLGYEIKLPTPTYFDAFGQFFNNMTQMGVIVTVLVFSGVVSLEKTKGTLILMLTKRLSRVSFLMSKFIAMVLLYTAGYILSAAACLFYTFYFFPNTELDGVLLSFFCLWLFMLLIIAITLLTSTLSSNNYIGTIGAFVGWFVLIMTNYIPKVKLATPLVLSTWNMSIIKGDKNLENLVLPMSTCFILIIIVLFGTCLFFKKQEI